MVDNLSWLKFQAPIKSIATALLLLFVIGTANSQSFREQFTEANLLTEDGYYGLAIPIWSDLLKERTTPTLITNLEVVT
jgi:hypothetical protein